MGRKKEMTLSDIQKLVLQGESETLEFKKSTAQLHAAFETICAFLNGGGGTVLIGVTDNGNIIGQDVSDATKINIAHEIGKIEPRGEVDISYVVTEKQKYVIAINSSASLYCPYMYDGRAFQRDQSVTRRMTQQQYDHLLSRRSQFNYSWETFEANYDLRELDSERIFDFMHAAVNARRMPESALKEDKEKLLERLKLIKNGKLINAAVVLFGKEFLPNFPQCQLKVARFKGVDRKEFIDSDIFYGNAFNLLEKAEEFIKKSLPLAAQILPGKLERIETPLVPYEAIRESLINSICHRDYSVLGGSIALAIYDDRLELFNNGGLPKGVSLEMIKNGYSDPRNPLIADVFHKAGLIEKWGRGVQEIISSCLRAGDPEPEFVINNGLTFTVILRFPRHLRNVISIEYSAEEVSRRVGLDIEIIKPLTKRQREILVILSTKEEMTANQIRQDLQEKPIERTLRNELYKLENLGYIGNKGATKNSKWFLNKN